MSFARIESFRLLLCILLCLFVDSKAKGQESEARPSTIAFKVRMDQLLKHKQLQAMIGMRKDDPTFSQIESIKGVVSLPEDIKELIEPEDNDDPPLDFYVLIEMKEEYSNTKMFEQIESTGKKLRELDGTVFYAPSPESKSEIAFEGKTMTMFSSSFRYQRDQLPKMTSQLEKMFKSRNQSDAMIVLDFKNNSALMKSLVVYGKGNMPPMAEPYLEILEKFESGVASVKLEKETTIIEMRIDCSTADDANRLNQMLDELIQIAKATVEDDLSGDATVKMLDSLKSRVVGKSVEATMALSNLYEKTSQRILLMNNARQIVLCMHNFESAFQRLPFHSANNESEQISWRVKMLPYMEQGELFEKFDLSKPWDSPENKKLLDQMPEVFGTEGNKTNLCWIKSEVRKFGDITRGSSNTIAFVYSDKYVPWTENNDVTPDDVLKQYKNLKPGEYLTATMYDGSVKTFAAGMEPEKFEELLYPADKEQDRK